MLDFDYIQQTSVYIFQCVPMFALSSMISENIMPSLCIGNHIYPNTMEQYPDSGEDISENMARYAEKWGSMYPDGRRPEGLHWPPISRHEGHIFRYDRDRVRIFSLY